VLLGTAENDPEAKSRVKALQQGLRDLGWSEPRNIQIDYRFVASNPNLIKKYVAEVVSLAPDVIVGNTTPVLAALSRQQAPFRSFLRRLMIQSVKDSFQAWHGRAPTLPALR